MYLLGRLSHNDSAQLSISPILLTVVVEVDYVFRLNIYCLNDLEQFKTSWIIQILDEFCFVCVRVNIEEKN